MLYATVLVYSMLSAPAHAQSTSCPVCTAEGVDTTLGPDPLRDQLRVDFMITDLLRKVLGKLDWCCCLRKGSTACGVCICRVNRHTRRLPLAELQAQACCACLADIWAAGPAVNQPGGACIAVAGAEP